MDLFSLGLEGRANGVRACNGRAGTYSYLVCAAIVLAAMVLTVLDVTGNTVIVMTSAFLIVHFYNSLIYNRKT